MFANPRTRAANDLISSLKRRQLLELKADGAELVSEIEALLESFERRLTKPSPELIEELSTSLCELMLESDHVDEIFADNAELSRHANAALMDYLEGIARRPPPPTKNAGQALPKKPLTLAEQGLGFALFEGSRESLVSDGEGPCAVCNAQSDIRFNRACYACFHAGKAPRGVATELGTIDAEALSSGYASPIPATHARAEWSTAPAPSEGDEEWVRCKIDPTSARELVKTPQYSTWQGESWLFCCSRPMVFTGTPDAERTDAKSLASMLETTIAEGEKRLEELTEQRISVYAFRCAKCGKRRAHWDMD